MRIDSPNKINKHPHPAGPADKPISKGAVGDIIVIPRKTIMNQSAKVWI